MVKKNNLLKRIGSALTVPVATAMIYLGTPKDTNAMTISHYSYGGNEYSMGIDNDNQVPVHFISYMTPFQDLDMISGYITPDNLWNTTTELDNNGYVRVNHNAYSGINMDSGAGARFGFNINEQLFQERYGTTLEEAARNLTEQLGYADGFLIPGVDHFTYMAPDLEYQTTAPVPEPASIILLGSGLCTLFGIRKKNRKLDTIITSCASMLFSGILLRHSGLDPAAMRYYAGFRLSPE